MIFVLGWILLWLRPEHKFVIFFGAALVVLDMITYLVFGGLPATLTGSFDVMATGSLVYDYLVNSLLPLTIFLSVGCAIVALRKLMKGRKSPGEAHSGRARGARVQIMSPPRHRHSGRDEVAIRNPGATAPSLAPGFRVRRCATPRND